VLRDVPDARSNVRFAVESESTERVEPAAIRNPNPEVDTLTVLISVPVAVWNSRADVLRRNPDAVSKPSADVDILTVLISLPVAV
jgi:hypothetical protein